jgi:tetratricopeptide (TPR) repeat protein
VRQPLGVTAFGINAYRADAGEQLIEPHDETGSGAGRHEELYVVVSGRATFTVDGEEIDAPAGTLVFVPERESRREAVAVEPETTAFVVGGKAGAAGPVSPWEYWFAAEPAYRAKDYDRAYEIAAEGLRDWPDHATIHYQLACYRALGGRREDAVEHLSRAFELDSRTREWAERDSDLDSVRDAI